MRHSWNDPLPRRRPVMLGLVLASVLGGCGHPSTTPAVEEVAPPPLPAMWGLARLDPPKIDAEEAKSWPLHRDVRLLSWRVMALTSCGQAVDGGPYRREILRAVELLKASQWEESRGCPPSHPFFGGMSQVGLSPPDLTHTALALQAQRQAGIPQDDPCIRRALGFIARCQVTPSRSGVGAGASGLDDGGFTERPVAENPTGKIPSGRPSTPRGVTTCLGLTSLLAGGASPQDPRVQAAVGWLQRHYTLDGHPGMDRAEEGLFGYYLEFAKAMTTLGYDHIRDRQGLSHDWRDELARRLTDRQNPDGSWTNPAESPDPAGSSPVIVTSYALLTLHQLGALKSAPQPPAGDPITAGKFVSASSRVGR